MRKILIDGDPGHDDTIAFLTALGNDDKLDIMGFTTVAGNADVQNCTKNILKIMDYLGVSIPVAQGYGSPLCRPLDNAAKYHGETGLDGGLSYPAATSKPVKDHAIIFLRDQILNCDQKVTLLTLGPLTNIAVLVKTFPEVMDNIDEVVMMAGSYASGNMLAKSEFNMYADPEAAKIVFDSGMKLVLATMEACYSGGILLTEQEKFKDGGRVSRLVYDILKFYSRYAVSNGWDRTAVYDLTPVIYLLAPEIFEYRDMRVDIEVNGVYTRGMTVCDDRGPTYIGEPDNPKRVLLSLDRDKLVEILFETMERLDRRFA
ncbi:MAG: nucleoside hydrolase [Erysipelotrichaceae bacterium]|nr:nucleoside hydrolase [Erysipelotrichaceae bacterium]